MVLVVVAQRRSAALRPSEPPGYVTSLSPLGHWFAFRNLLIKRKTSVSVCKYNLGQFPTGAITKPNHTGRPGPDNSFCSEGGFHV